MSNFTNYSQYSLSKQICIKNTASQGPQGLKGPQGATGPKGVQGATGSQGSKGPQGYCCVGQTGPQGAQGPQGNGGGPAGPTGPTGPAGSGYVINTFIENELLNIRSNFDLPAYYSSISTFSGNFNGSWALSWGISEGNVSNPFSDPNNQFCITFTGTTFTGTTEYSPIIYNKTTPYTLNNNSSSTTGSANDIINISAPESSLILNIYQSSSNLSYIGSNPPFSFTVTLTKV
jgi:hypothetical protein